jgi:hypothetical protein
MSTCVDNESYIAGPGYSTTMWNVGEAADWFSLVEALQIPMTLFVIFSVSSNIHDCILFEHMKKCLITNF